MPLLGSNTLCVSVYQPLLLLDLLTVSVILFCPRQEECLYVGNSCWAEDHFSPGFLTRPLPNAYAYVGVRQRHVPSSNAVIT
jgi:hypothetical protein